jgi:carbon-monoxide dehydrogenase large subunit
VVFHGVVAPEWPIAHLLTGEATVVRGEEMPSPEHSDRRWDRYGDRARRPGGLDAMSRSLLGHRVPRIEDPGMVAGSTLYLADLSPAGVLHVSFVRSTVPHGRMSRIDLTRARRSSGVTEVVTAEDLGIPPQPGFFSIPDSFNRPVLATDVVRYVGEPIAAVVATSEAAAVDGAESVVVDYAPLTSVSDPRSALLEDAPLLFPAAGSNLVAEYRTEAEPALLTGEDLVVRADFVNQRVAGVPIESSAALAEPDGDGVTLWCTTQSPAGARDAVANALDVDPARVRVRTAAVGGGFGSKGPVYPEFVVVAALALRLGVPVKWIETRSENLVNMAHGRGQFQTVELGVTRAGQFRWLKLDVVADAGAYPHIGAFLPSMSMLMASGPYRIPVVDYRARSVATNTTPVASFRGAGRPEATAALERIVDMTAVELGIDPVDIRRRNLLEPDAFPVTTPTGANMDSGDYGSTLGRVLSEGRYDDARREQQRRRSAAATRLLGIGVAVHVEVTAGEMHEEIGSVEVDRAGRIVARVGTHSQGQGHETTFAQIVSSVLGVSPGKVSLLESDTAQVPEGMGTAASRSVQIGGSALHESAVSVLDQARELAARLLEASADDIEITGAGLAVAGVPTSQLSWRDLAEAALDTAEGSRDARLSAEMRFDQGDATYPFGSHLAVVEVDTETGGVRLVRFVAVDDCGRVINPMLAEGQIHGGVAQGVAQALFEEVVFDEIGNPMTTTLVDYSVPSAADLPRIETHWTETPTPRNPLGAKGIGESGTIGATPAVQNAVIDALAHLGVRHIDMPLGPERVWRAIQAPGR